MRLQLLVFFSVLAPWMVYAQTSAPAPLCSNQSVEQGEECDDGNFLLGDGCDNDCHREPPVCGNSRLEEWAEDCDDGNTQNGDQCPADCLKPLPAYKRLNAPIWRSLVPTVLGVGSVGLVAALDSKIPGPAVDALGSMSVLTGAFGIMIGPSMGQFYSGHKHNGLRQIGFRLGGVVLISTGVIFALNDSFVSTGLVASGGLVIGGSAIASIVDTIKISKLSKEQAKSRAEKLKQRTTTTFLPSP